MCRKRPPYSKSGLAHPRHTRHDQQEEHREDGEGTETDSIVEDDAHSMHLLPRPG